METNIKEKIEIKIKKPKMYKVIMHNDDYTSMEFVIMVLVEVFNKKVPEATQVMYDVHKKGVGVAGVYAYDIANTKIIQAENLAQLEGYPFKLSLEEE